MIEVYKARDGRLGRTVAVNILADTLATDPSSQARFLISAPLGSADTDPNQRHRQLALGDRHTVNAPLTSFPLDLSDSWLI